MMESILNKVGFFLTDAQRSTIALADDTGTVDADHNFTYNAFGELQDDPAPTSLGTKYLYTGQYFDAFNTELYNLRARQYDPNNGRFLSRDKWAYDYNNPVELNRYVYTHNNPVRYTDPSGYNATITWNQPNRMAVEQVGPPQKPGPVRNFGGVLGGISGYIGGTMFGLLRYQAIAGDAEMCGANVAARARQIGRAGFSQLSGIGGAAVGALVGWASWEVAAGTLAPETVPLLTSGLALISLTGSLPTIFWGDTEEKICAVFDALLTAATAGGGGATRNPPPLIPVANGNTMQLMGIGTGSLNGGILGGLLTTGGILFASDNTNDNTSDTEDWRYDPPIRKRVSTADLVPNPDDPFNRRNPSRNTSVIDAARDRIRNGFGGILGFFNSRDPSLPNKAISVLEGDDGKYYIIDGHHRWWAALGEGLQTVRVDIIGRMIPDVN